MITSKYTIEMYSRDGVLLTDLTGRARRRRLVKSRNEADDIGFELDMNDFERHCRKMGLDPRDLLIGGQTEVRVKRGDTYLAGGQIDYVNPYVRGDRAIIEVRASGFLNLFKDRYTDEASFTAVQATSIAADLINDSQAKGVDWDFGVTIGTLATVGVHDRTFKQDATSIKEVLQDLTTAPVNAFDFEFTADKVFNTYAAIGSPRPDVVFEFPGNIKYFSAPIDATRIANYVMGKGIGAGDEAQARYVGDDSNSAIAAASEITYKVRQRPVTSNATDNSDNGLTDRVNSELESWAFPFQVPAFTVNGNATPFIGDYGIGDYIRVDASKGPYKMFQHINALYRLEKYELSVDDDDMEEVTLYVSA